MAKFTLPIQPDTCPFMRAAAMQMEGQRARIHAVGEGERAEIDVRCIRNDCMMWNTTNAEKNLGGCGAAVGPAFLAAINVNMAELNNKIDTFAYGMVEATEALRDKGGTFLDHLTAKIKPLFAPPDDAPAVPTKPKLEAVKEP